MKLSMIIFGTLLLALAAKAEPTERTNSTVNTHLPICEYRGYKLDDVMTKHPENFCYDGPGKYNGVMAQMGSHVIGIADNEVKVAKECIYNNHYNHGPIPLLNGLKLVKQTITDLESKEICRHEAVECSIGLTYADPGAINGGEYFSENNVYLQIGDPPKNKFNEWPTHRTTYFWHGEPSFYSNTNKAEYSYSANRNGDTYIGGRLVPFTLAETELPLTKAKLALDYLVSVGICKPYRVEKCEFNWFSSWVSNRRGQHAVKALKIKGGLLVAGELLPAKYGYHQCGNAETLANIMTKIGLCSSAAVDPEKFCP